MRVQNLNRILIELPKIDNNQQCFVFMPNFSSHNLNFQWKWRWWHQIWTTFIILTTLAIFVFWISVVPFDVPGRFFGRSKIVGLFLYILPCLSVRFCPFIHHLKNQLLNDPSEQRNEPVVFCHSANWVVLNLLFLSSNFLETSHFKNLTWNNHVKVFLFRIRYLKENKGTNINCFEIRNSLKKDKLDILYVIIYGWNLWN